MKHILFILLCASCRSWSQAGDVLMPDELTIGKGEGSHYGGIQTHSPRWDYEGESETTYAALTWAIPSFEDDSGLTREERSALRELNLQKELDAQESEASEDSGELIGMNIREGMSPPPTELVIAFLAVFFGAVAFVGIRRVRKADPWR